MKNISIFTKGSPVALILIGGMLTIFFAACAPVDTPEVPPPAGQTPGADSGLHERPQPVRPTAVPELKPGDQAGAPVLQGVELIDLSPELPLKDKFDVYVQRGDGTIIQFLIGLSPSGLEAFSSHPADLPAEILHDLSLSAADRVLFWQPPELYRTTPK